MPERILDRVPAEFQLNPDSQRLRHQLLDADPNLGSRHELFEEVLGLILYNNYTAGKYSSPRRLQTREMNKSLAEAYIADDRCVDGRVSNKQQGENPIHTEPGSFTKRTQRIYRRTKGESGGIYLPRSPYLRVGIEKSTEGNRDLIEFVEGHFMEEPLRGIQGDFEDPYEPCGQVVAMIKKGEIKEQDLIKAHIEKINEITIPSVTDWYNDCRDVRRKPLLARVCLPLMQDTVTRGYVLDLDQRDKRSPLSVPELVKINRGKIESHLGRLVGGYGSKTEWLTDPEKIVDLDEFRYEITRGLMQDTALQSFKDDVYAYLTDHYPDLTDQQRTGSLFKFADNAALLYLQGSAYGESEHPNKWHNERCIVISPKGNPPFVYFPDVQSFVATPPEPERTITYANTMIGLWKHYREEAKHRNPQTRMPQEILMFLTIPVAGELNESNYNYLSALGDSSELFQTMINDKAQIDGATKYDLYKSGLLNSYSLLYNYQTRVIRAVVDNRAIANR